MNTNISISIIVPIYKVEKHIGRCVRSLMEQSYKHIEYIFVDDASPDRSMEVLRQTLAAYPEREAAVKIISHEINQGLPAARNTGLAIAKGDYIFHCDSDDWIDGDMMEDMVRVIEQQGSDVIYTDFYLSFYKNERYMKQPAYREPKDCLQAMLSGGMKFNVWNKLVKRSLYTDHAITFPSGRSMGEDMTMMKLFCHAKTVSYIPKAYYHYMQTNPNAYTKCVSERQLDEIALNTADLINYVCQVYGEKYFASEIAYFKLNIKLPFLISLDRKMYDLWRLWYPESNPFIRDNPAFSTRVRFIQYAALKKQDWLVQLYNYLIVRFVYGFIYR